MNTATWVCAVVYGVIAVAMFIWVRIGDPENNRMERAYGIEGQPIAMTAIVTLFWPISLILVWWQRPR